MDHWTGRRHQEGEAYGPFAFLNPTTRRVPLPAQKANSSEEDVQGKNSSDGNTTGPSGPSSGETRAEDVYAKWRSRDNRKGWTPPSVYLIKTNV